MISINLIFSNIRWLILTCIFSSSWAFQLHTGDLLFQDENCGKFCDGINSVTVGYHNSYVSHVAIVVEPGNKPYVVEAITDGVVKTPLDKFLKRSLDKNNKPRVMIGRLKPEYQYLIPNAIKFANKQIGKPYNDTFIPNKGRSYYCSELIYAAYKSNKKPNPFHQNPMNFADWKTHVILPIWQNYYKKLHVAVPQGMPGTNPGQMSRESSIDIIYYYGELRTQK